LAIERHLYPGNNTPYGFFSYYQYILGQREASKIVCIKGGPGVGKSTFMKKIAEEFLEKGEDIDFMHCSSDPDSLDGIVLKNKKIAFIDATSPHVVDPISPGAVDSIVHLGEFWNEAGIRANKIGVIESNEKIKRWFSLGYNYLAAAKNIYDNLSIVYDTAIENAEIYKLTAKIVGDELSHKEICLKPGDVKKYFASAITPKGCQNHIRNLIEGYKKIYLLNGPIGVSSEALLNVFSEGAVYRGYNIEQYYCSMKPDRKLEHLLVPELSVAFVSTNSYHDVEPWQLVNGKDGEERYPELALIDWSDIIEWNKLEGFKDFIEHSLSAMDQLLEDAIGCIKNAKKEHDVLETYYIPNMDFKKIEDLRKEIIAKIQ